MSQRTGGVSKRRVAAKSNAAGAPDGEVDTAFEEESDLPSLTADLVPRHADARVLSFAISSPAETEIDESRFAGPGAQFLVRKGEAAPSAYAPRATVPADDHASEELHWLRNEAHRLEAALAESESEVTRLTMVIEQAGAIWAGEAQDLLKKAEQDWKADEAARFAAAEARWREASVMAAAAESSDAKTARAQAEAELHGVRDEWSAMKTTLASRESELAQARSALDEAQKRWQQDSEAALAKAKSVWRADVDKEFQRLRDELSGVQAALAERDAALARAKAEEIEARQAPESPQKEEPANNGSTRTMGGERFSEEFSALRDKHAADQERRAAKMRGPIRDLILAVSVGILAFVAYPRIAPLLPESLRSNAGVTTGKSSPADNSASPVQTAEPAKADVKPASIIVREVILRVSPSASAAVMATLPPGVKVTPLEQSGNWTRVRVEVDAKNPKLREGWLLGSFSGTPAKTPPSAKAK